MHWSDGQQCMVWATLFLGAQAAFAQADLRRTR